MGQLFSQVFNLKIIERNIKPLHDKDTTIIVVFKILIQSPHTTLIQGWHKKLNQKKQLGFLWFEN